MLSLWKVDDDATSLLMTRFYQNLLGRRPGLDAPMPRAAALHEARQWLRNLTADQVDTALSGLDRGEIVRIPGRPVDLDDRPFAHPRFWAGFILIGNPN